MLIFKVFTVSIGYGDRPLTTAFCNFLQVFNKRNPKMIKFAMEELYEKIKERLAVIYSWADIYVKPSHYCYIASP